MARNCRHCGMAGHTAMTCFARPKGQGLKRTPLKTNGKQASKWFNTRAEWFKQNPAEFYFCYYCGQRLSLKETTLDHFYSRSRRPDLRHDLSNLVPCCYFDNKQKGSLSGDEYIAKYYPNKTVDFA